MPLHRLGIGRIGNIPPMSSDELLEDTNRLLRRLVEIEAEQRELAAKTRLEFEEKKAAWTQENKDKMRDLLVERGVPKEVAEIPEVDFEKRRGETLRRSKENMESALAREKEYKTQLLEELRTQSELLRLIAERLDK